MVLQDLHGKVPGPEFEQTWKKADKDKTGFLDFDEFIECMCANKWHKLLDGAPGVNCSSMDKLCQDNALFTKVRQREDSMAHEFAETVSKAAAERMAQHLANHAEASDRAMQHVSQAVGAHVNRAADCAAKQAAEKVVEHAAAQAAEVAQSAAQQATQTLADHLVAQLGRSAGEVAVHALTKDRLSQRLSELAASTDMLRHACEGKHEALQADIAEAVKMLKRAGATPRRVCTTETQTESVAVAAKVVGQAAPVSPLPGRALNFAHAASLSCPREGFMRSCDQLGATLPVQMVMQEAGMPGMRLPAQTPATVSCMVPAHSLELGAARLAHAMTAPLAAPVGKLSETRQLSSEPLPSAVPTYLRGGRQVPCLQLGLEAIRVQVAELEEWEGEEERRKKPSSSHF